MTYNEKLKQRAEEMAIEWAKGMSAHVDIAFLAEQFIPLAKLSLHREAEGVIAAFHWRDDIEHYLESHGYEPQNS